jgi:hypothetical protein
VYDRVEDVNFDSLPNRFVLKCAYGSNGILICQDKQAFDYVAARKGMQRWLDSDYYAGHREWVYRSLPPRIVAERFLEDRHGELNDYKIFCFGGEPKMIEVDFDRFTHHTRNIYDIEWNLQPFGIRFPTDHGRTVPKPSALSEMLDVSRILSGGFPHVRVDLYDVDGSVFFGEMTFFHGGGVETFTDDEYGHRFGSWLHLPDPKRS